MSELRELSKALSSSLENEPLTRSTGRVRAAVGLGVTVHMPAARRGEWVRILRRHAPALDAEVVGFSGEDVMLMPLGDSRGVGPDDLVEKIAPEDWIEEIRVSPEIWSEDADLLRELIKARCPALQSRIGSSPLTNAPSHAESCWSEIEADVFQENAEKNWPAFLWEP